MYFKRLNFFFFLLTVFSLSFGEYTIHLLNPWAKDSTRSKSPVYIISGESGWWPGTKMISEGGNWLSYTFYYTDSSSNDRIEFMSVIPATSDSLANALHYTGATKQIFMKDLFAGHGKEKEIWLTVTDTTKYPEISFTPPKFRIIWFFRPWDFGGAFMEIKNFGSLKMKGASDYCGWLAVRYLGNPDSLFVKFRNSFDSTMYSSTGLGNGGYIDLSKSFTKGDTVWILATPYPAGPPVISSTDPGNRGVCNTITIASTLYDKSETHPDFTGKDPPTSWHVYPGLVKKRLGANGKPVKSADSAYWISDRFGDWFLPETLSNGYTNTKCLNLTLHTNDEGLFEYDTNAFFPLDSFKFLDPNKTIPNPDYQGWDHNYKFTMETGASFEYVKGQRFYFRGDDDVWVFIDSILRVDLGGIHGPTEGSVNLDTLGLTPGKTYSFKLFFAERYGGGSNFRMVTSIALRTSSKLFYTDTLIAPGATKYNIFEKITKDNMTCDASGVPIDTVKAAVEFYIEGPPFSTQSKLPVGNSYGGITILPDFTGIILDEPSIVGLPVGEYVIHYYSKKESTMEGIFHFTVTLRPRITNPVKNAAYYSDNVNGSVDRAEIFFTDTLKTLPDSVLLSWPTIQNYKIIAPSGIILDSLNKRHITIRLTDPFPKELTTYSGSSQLGKCYFIDTTFKSNPLLTVPFSIADSVGPLIKSALLIERIEPGNDTMLLTFSELLKDSSLIGSSLILFKNGKKITLNILKTFPKGDSTVCIIGDQKENAPGIHDSIAFNSAGPVRDAYGNPPHIDNRPVPFLFRKIPGKLINAYYLDPDADGIVDKAILKFNKNVTRSEFTATFNWINKFVDFDSTKFSFGKDSSEINVNLSGAFSQQIQTSGEMSVHIESTSNQGGQEISLADSASPVLVSAEYSPGVPRNGNKTSDTLTCSFSEKINVINCVNPFLFLRADAGQKTEYQMSLTDSSTIENKWVFIINEIKGVDFPESSDSVWINDSCGIADTAGNKQVNHGNRHVLLKVNIIPIIYKVSVGPNPIQLSEPGSAAASTTIKIEPSFRLKQFVDYYVDISIFDAIGNVVYKNSAESQNSPTMIVSFVWNGHNRNGRTVGSGTYIAVIKIHDLKRNSVEKHSVPIGVKR